MAQPASRITDMHVCPLSTPGTPPIPHVGGIILPPGVVTVLVGNLPAATVGDMCMCVGPPDAIVMGATTILVNSKPGARISSSTAHGGTVTLGYPTVLYGEGLSAIAALVSPEVLALIMQSPSLVAMLSELSNSGWTFTSGPPGDGTYADRTTSTISIDANDVTDPLSCTSALAHEAGHALYNEDPYVPMDGLSRDEYIDQNTMRHLKDEGEATLTNTEVRSEIQKTSGTDIGISGTHTDEYQDVYDRYRDHGDRDAARTEIGNIFSHGENPSGDDNAGKDYYDYYSENYGNEYDAQHPPSP
jgi:uncharacterized Zn-binding protein involved in type VI secretion